jgi:hypothetical protein
LTDAVVVDGVGSAPLYVLRSASQPLTRFPSQLW